MLKTVYKTVVLAREFESLEQADDWLDVMLDEFDEYETASTLIKGGSGVYRAEVTLDTFEEMEVDEDGLVRQGGREPDLFDPS